MTIEATETRSTQSKGFLTIPNALTLLRIGLIPVFVWATIAGAFMLALVTFVGAAVTDALDGYLARRLNQRSRIGALLDPAADKTMMVSGFIVLTLPGIAMHRLPFWLTFAVFARDVLIVLFAYLLYTRIRIQRFPPSIAGKTSTILQAVALAFTIGANTVLSPFLVPFLPWIHRLSLVATLYSGFDYMQRWDRRIEDEE